MTDLVLSPVIIASNLLKFVQDSAVASSAVYKSPEKFDPQAVDKWFQVYIPTIAQTVGRQEVGLEWKGVIRCEVFSRNQDSQMEVLKLASDIQAAICQEHFVALDNTDVATPAVGFVSIYEPQIQCRGGNGSYQMAVLTANFKVTRTA
jgi:hypothetical protein